MAHIETYEAHLEDGSGTLPLRLVSFDDFPISYITSTPAQESLLAYVSARMFTESEFGKQFEDPLAVPILRGGILRAREMVDVVDGFRLLDNPNANRSVIDAMRVQFYTSSAANETTDKPTIHHRTRNEVSGRDLYYLEEVIDTGETICESIEDARRNGARRQAVLALTEKEGARLPEGSDVAQFPAVKIPKFWWNYSGDNMESILDINKVMIEKGVYDSRERKAMVEIIMGVGEIPYADQRLSVFIERFFANQPPQDLGNRKPLEHSIVVK